jgi:hypothetical protein
MSRATLSDSGGRVGRQIHAFLERRSELALSLPNGTAESVTWKDGGVSVSAKGAAFISSSPRRGF